MLITKNVDIKILIKIGLTEAEKAVAIGKKGKSLAKHFHEEG